MKRFLLLVLTILFVGVSQMEAQADTTWVQTYTFEEQNNPETAYDSPGRKWFTFPDDGTEYRKVLMYQKLKCFEDGTAGDLGWACGEWDYLSYYYLYDHTGMLDSTASEHPQFLLNNQDFEFITVSGEAQYDYIETQLFSGTETIGTDEQTEVGLGAAIYENTLGENSKTARTQLLWTAAELTTAGLLAGDISGLIFHNESVNFEDHLLKVRIKNSAETEFTQFSEGDSQVVYFWNTQFTDNGESEIIFSEAFNWDGTSSIIVEIESLSQEELEEGNDFYCDDVGTNSYIQSRGNDSYLDLGDGDLLSVPAEAFENVADEITISFWAYGDEDILPVNTYAFEGVNAANQRVVNAHLPWSNARVYWDAGQDGGYDRIEKDAGNSDLEGEWNHWAFTKNTVSGVMNMYLNGALWHTGDGKDNTMADIVKFYIGANSSGTTYWYGRMDEFRIWDIELTEENIANWMYKDLDITHPEYEHLLAYYDFNQESTEAFFDKSPNGYDAIPLGSPLRIAYEATDLFRNIDIKTIRPKITFKQGNTIESGNSDTVLIPVPLEPAVISEWEIDGNYVELIEWNYYWGNSTSTTYDEDGNVISTESLILDTYVENETLEYFQPPFEVIDRYELGRYITPYGIYLDLEEGWTWVYDVTDFANLLQGEVELNCGNWQELLDLKFAMIEGTAPRDLIRLENIWSGNFGLTTIDETIAEATIEVEDGEEGFRFSAITSGHGNPGCAEFCNNTHSLKVDGNEEWSWEIMQECADNPLRPQGGTWIYDRAGWCPGDKVTVREFELTQLVAGQSSFTLDYDAEIESAGNYVFEGQLATYGAPNFSNDVELEDIIAPSNVRVKSHINPMCKKPIIRIRNTGSTNLTSCVISYGINGNFETYTWTGDLAFMEMEEVELNYTDPQIYAGDTDALMTFEVTVSQPNGVTDENGSNDYGASHFKRPPVYSYGTGDDDHNELVVYLQTNDFYYETTWSLYDENNNLLFSRDDFSEPMTAYRDTLEIGRGCYLFHVEDSDDDGISFWADDDGNGDVRLRKVTSGNWVTFDDDFGKEIYHYFYWDTDLVGVEELAPEKRASLVVYPNPSEGEFKVRMKNLKENVHIEVYDLHGKVVYSSDYLNIGEQVMKNLNLSHLSAGIYNVRVSDGEQVVTKKITIM